MRFYLLFLCILGLACQADAATAQQTKLALEQMKVVSQQMVTAILGVPLHEQTFENTLGMWTQLSSQMYKQSNEFYESTQLKKLKDSKMASWALAELQNMGASIAGNEELTTLLLNAAQRLLNAEHTPMQSYIAQSYIKNKGAKSVNFYLYKTDDLKVSPNKKLSFLSLPGVQDIIPTDADVLCIQEIFPDDAYEVCESLFGQSYDHMIYFRPCNVGLDMSLQQYAGGMLIASKYPLEKIEVNDDYMDVLINDAEGILGHLYAIQCSGDPAHSQVKLERTIAAMQEECMQLGLAPAILCANFDRLLCSKETRELMNAYFSMDVNSAQFLCPAPKFMLVMHSRDPLAHKSSRDRRRDDPHDNRDYSSHGWSGNNDHQCYRTKDDENSNKVAGSDKKERNNEIKVAKNDKESKNNIQGEAYLGAKRETDGSTSAKADISLSKTTESGGSMTATASGSFTQDKNGNFSGTAELGIGLRW